MQENIPLKEKKDFNKMEKSRKNNKPCSSRAWRAALSLFSTILIKSYLQLNETSKFFSVVVSRGANTPWWAYNPIEVYNDKSREALLPALFVLRWHRHCDTKSSLQVDDDGILKSKQLEVMAILNWKGWKIIKSYVSTFHLFEEIMGGVSGAKYRKRGKSKTLQKEMIQYFLISKH